MTVTDGSQKTPTLEGGGKERIALLVDTDSLDGSAPVECLETEELGRVIAEVLATLPARERVIISATQEVGSQRKLEGLGARFGVS